MMGVLGEDCHQGFEATTVRAVLFDIDGTLYPQMPLRALMAAEIALEGLRARSAGRVRRLVQVIAAFRRVREELRDLGEPAAERLDELQFSGTAARLRIDVDEVRNVIEEWVIQRPVKHLRYLRRSGLARLLTTLSGRQLKVGALSDYPGEQKLQALGVAEAFSFSLCTADPSINAFKPHPKGFWRACEMWNVAPQEVLYVGDRSDVDNAGAAAAGMRCFIVGSRIGRGRAGRDGFGAFAEIRRALAV